MSVSQPFGSRLTVASMVQVIRPTDVEEPIIIIIIIIIIWGSTSVHPIPVSVAVLSTHGAFTRWCANMHLADSRDTTPLTTSSHVPLSPREFQF